MGTPRSSQVCQGLCLPPAFPAPKPAPNLLCSPCSAHLPHICCSLLLPASLEPFTVVGYLALKTSSIKNYWNTHNKAQEHRAHQTTCFFLFASLSPVLLCAFKKELFVSSALILPVKHHSYLTQLARQIPVPKMSWP